MLHNKEKLLQGGTAGALLGLGLGIASRKAFNDDDRGLSNLEKQKKYKKYSLSGALAGAATGVGITFANHHFKSNNAHKRVHEGKSVNQVANDFANNHPHKDTVDVNELKGRYKRRWEADFNAYGHNIEGLQRIRNHRRTGEPPRENAPLHIFTQLFFPSSDRQTDATLKSSKEGFAKALRDRAYEHEL